VDVSRHEIILNVRKNYAFLESRGKDVEGLTDEGTGLGLERAQEGHIDLQYDLGRRFVGLDEATDQYVRGLLAGRVLALEVAPRKLYKLLSVQQ